MLAVLFYILTDLGSIHSSLCMPCKNWLCTCTLIPHKEKKNMNDRVVSPSTKKPKICRYCLLCSIHILLYCVGYHVVIQTSHMKIHATLKTPDKVGRKFRDFIHAFTYRCTQGTHHLVPSAKAKSSPGDQKEKFDYCNKSSCPAKSETYIYFEFQSTSPELLILFNISMLGHLTGLGDHIIKLVPLQLKYPGFGL